jgi:hypothetical protein
MGDEDDRMEKLRGNRDIQVGWRTAASCRIKFLRSKGLPRLIDRMPFIGQATFFNTSAEFFEPNPTQLQIACSMRALRPMSGT